MPAEVAAPGRCHLAFGIPLDLAGFRRDLESPEKDFVRSCCPLWPRYRSHVIAPATRLIDDSIGRGVNVVRDATAADLAELFRQPSDAVIVVSHWLDDQIELADGMYRIEDIVACVPETFDGVIDLCVCNPEPLAIALRERRLSCITRYAQIPAIPYILFGYYRALLHRLARQDCSYLTASVEVIRLLMTPSKEKR
jgi:hypothetical protein